MLTPIQARQLDAAANTLFLNALRGEMPSSYAPLLAASRTTNKRTENGLFVGGGPAMELIRDGEPYPTIPMESAAVSAVMKKYGAKVSLSREDWEDDQLGVFNDQVADLGRDAVHLVNDLMVTALVGGLSATGYDEVAFFSASHPARGQQSKTYSNLLTGTGTTTAQTANDLGSAIGQFYTFERENGRPMNPRVRDLTVVANPTNYKAVVEATRANEISNTDNVVVRGMNYELIFDPRMTANDLIVVNRTSSVRPLVLWERVAASLEAEAPNSGGSFNYDTRSWKSRWRGDVQLYAWQSAIYINN